MSAGAGEQVTHDRPGHRFVLVQEGAEAELVYREDGRRLVLEHTGVPDAIAGRGVAGRLMRAAVDRAREEGLTVVPVCSYARAWLERNQSESAGLDIAWSTGGGRPGLD